MSRRCRTNRTTAALAMLLGLAAAGCGQATAPAAPVAATYALQTVDGQPLPWSPGPPDAGALLADTLTLTRDGRWREARWAAAPGGVPARVPAFGTWALDGATLRLTNPAASSTEALTSRYTVADDGRTFATAPGAVARPVQRFGRVP